MMEGVIDIVQHFATVMTGYSRTVFASLSSGCSVLYNTVFGLWFVWQLIGQGLLKGELKGRMFVQSTLTGLMVNTVLQTALYFEWIYEPLSSLTLDFIQTIIKAVNGQTSGSVMTIESLLRVQYQELDIVFNILRSMIGDMSLGNLIAPIATFVLNLPFIFIYFMLICYFLNYVFSLMCVTALSPLLIIYAGFKATRSISTGGLKLIMHATLTLACSIIAMGLSIYALRYMMAALPITPDGTIKGSAASFAFSADYWKCFLIACMTIYFQLSCPKIANITGFADGPGAAAFVAGFAATTMATVATFMMKPLKKLPDQLLNPLAEWAKDRTSDAGRNLRERFRPSSVASKLGESLDAHR